MSKEKTIVVDNYGIDRKFATIYIEGDSDLILNKTNNAAIRTLTADDGKKQRKWEQDHRNVWEQIITAIHWYDPIGFGIDETNSICDEEMMHRLLKENTPCIPAFAFHKTLSDAVVRNGIEKNKTKIEDDNNIIVPRGFCKVEITEWSFEELLMSPKSGSPVRVALNHFSGWRTSFGISYTESVYTLDNMVNFFNLAGFGLGIGSGRTSGYGRYHVADVK